MSSPVPHAMGFAPFQAPMGLSPYGAQVGLGQPFGLPSAVVAGGHFPTPIHPHILSSSALPTASTMSAWPPGTVGWAPPTVVPGATAPLASLYYPYAAPHPYAYGYPPSVPMAYAPQYAYPYPTYMPQPTAAPPSWLYGTLPPLATTAGPFAGAAVQTSTIQDPSAKRLSSPADANSTSGHTTSPVDAKSPSITGSGSDTAGAGFSSAEHTCNSPAAFNVQCSNRAISENRQLIVKFLTDDTTEPQFRELFERFGPVENARVIYDKKTNHTKGFGFITFQRAEDAVQALRTMGGYQLHGRQLNVALAQTERKRAFANGEFSPNPTSASGSD
jgi:hypothetical protein